MEGLKGYVTFKDKDIEEEKTINKNILVYNSIADSLRFFNLDDNKVITLVSVIGDYQKFNSEYYGYSDIILANNIKIKKILTYNEIIENMLVKDKTDEELSKFIKAYKLNEQDKERFSKISFDTWLAIKYFQDGQTGIYKEDTKSLIKKYYKRQ